MNTLTMASGRVFEALDLGSFHLQSKTQGSKSLPDLIQLDKDLTAKLKDCGFLLDSSTNMKDTSIEPVKKPDKTLLKVGGKPIVTAKTAASHIRKRFVKTCCIYSQ